MKLLIPRLSGFCPGVKYAEKILFQKRKNKAQIPIYVYGYMINNRKYIDYLKKFNILTVMAINKIEKGTHVAIRTHGINRNEEKYLQNHFQVIDLTCKHVKRVQLKIKEYSDQGYYILITGKKDHPEIKSLASYSHDYFIIETHKDLKVFLKKGKKLFHQINKPEYLSIMVVSQTTGSRELFETTIASVKQKWGQNIKIVVFDSICPVTDKKEKEALKMQKQAEISFVIGDKLSSNANKLYKTLKRKNKNVFFIEDIKELKSLNLCLANYNIALVVSSASTPMFVEKNILAYLEEL